MRTLNVLVVALFAFGRTASAISGPFYETNTWPHRSAMVQLFEWKWLDIAKECEEFLAPYGYAGVQISPPTENLVIWQDGARPWWERYQVLSYNLITRSGNEQDFAEMTRRCNAVGVRIFVDVVINHMSANSDSAVGTGGSKADPNAFSYPAIPFNASHFHQPTCQVNDWQDPIEVRNCEVVGLHDLDHAKPYVRQKIVDMLNHLIDLGVAGFRVDAAKHIWPHELKMMMEGMKYLNTDYGFAPNSKPFVYQEVIDHGGEKISYKEYAHIGRMIDFRHSSKISTVFKGDDQLRWLRNWGPDWNLIYGPISLVFVDNHDNQREEDGNGHILNYKKPKQYKMAVAFMLANPHGFPRVMSSFAFEKSNQGPPMTKEGDLISPAFGQDGQCNNGYVCEHRWRPIANMIGFKNSAGVTGMDNWWDNGSNQIAFSRGDKGFIAFNNEDKDMNVTLKTGLPMGIYCDVISGELTPNGHGCTGKVINVGTDGWAHISIRSNETEGVLAIHVGAMPV